MAWILILIACSVAAFRIRNPLLKYETVFFVAVSIVAIFANACFCLGEALNF